MPALPPTYRTQKLRRTRRTRPLPAAEPSSPGPLKWVVLALAVATAVTLAPLALPVILAIWFAAIVAPLFDRVARGLGGRHRAAAVVVVVLVLMLAGVAAVLVAAAVSGSTELWGLVSQSPGPRSALRALVSERETPPSDTLMPSFEVITAWLMQHGSQAVGLLSGIAGATVKLVLALLLFVFGTWTFLLNGARAWEWARARVPLAQPQVQRLAAAFIETGRGLLIGVGLSSASQAAAAVIIYLALGVPRALALGLLTGLASIIPVVGSALIWLPVAAGLLLTDHPVKGTVLLVLGAAVISTMDNLLRPLFSRFGKLDLPVYLLTLAMIGGLAMWGPAGALLGPVFARLLIEALALWRESQPGARAR